MRGHIRKRGKHSWTVYIYKGRDESGRRRYDTSTVRGSRDDAEAECTRLLRDLDTGSYVEPSRMTVEDLLLKWLDSARMSVAPKTFERYEEIVRKHLIPTLGSRLLTKLRALHIEAYYAEALATGRCNKRGGLSAQTVLHHHRVLRKALQKAVKWQLLTRNPAADVDPPRPERRQMQTLESDDTAQLLAAARRTRLYVAIVLAITTGMRRGEILALRWSDIDWQNRALSVRRSLEQTRKGGLRFKEPKTGRGRLIALPPLTVTALKQHRARQAARRLQLGAVFQDQDLVCEAGEGSPWSPVAVTSAFRKLIAKLDLPRVRLHDLRHSHATHLLREGVHPKVVSERLGHSKVGVTLDTYSHVLPTLQQEAAQRVQDSLEAAIRKARGAKRKK